MTAKEQKIYQCPLCGDAVEAVPKSEIPDFVRIVYPSEPGAKVKNARELIVGGFVVLHHGCLSPQANTESRWWDPDKLWWACRDLDRPIDDYANFDLNCAACAERWAAENRN